MKIEIGAWADEIAKAADEYVSLIGAELAKLDSEKDDPSRAAARKLRVLAYSVEGLRNRADGVAKWCKMGRTSNKGEE